MKNPESRRVFLPGDKAPERGQVFRNPDLAHALTLVANEGEAAYYKGEIAKAILRTSLMTLSYTALYGWLGWFTWRRWRADR